MTSTSHDIVRDWLKALGALCAGNMPSADVNAKLAAYTPLLVTEYPLPAFCRDSLAAVARNCKFFPTYAELCEHLGAWWREHDPTPRIAAPQVGQWSTDIPHPRAAPTEAEREYVGEIVHAFHVERSFYRKSGRLDADKPAIKSKPLSDEQLLAACEAAGKAGEHRANMIRKRIAEAAAKEATP